MIRHGLTRFTLLAIVLFGPTGAAVAQRPSDDSSSTPAATEETVSLVFPGGTIQEYIEALRGVAPGLNVMLASPEVAESPVSPVQLTDVSLRSALRLLAGIVVANNVDKQDEIDVSEIKQKNNHSRPVFRISSSVTRYRSRFISVAVHVWSVADILSVEMPEEAILTSIETAVELLRGKRQPAQIRFHKATGLIIASGDTDQLSAIDSVVKGLRESIAGKRAIEAPNEPDEQKDADVLQAVMAELDTFRKQLQEQANTIKELKGRIGKRR